MDTGHPSDEDWLLDVQRKLYQWSREHPEECYRQLWGWISDPRNLRCAWRRVASNKGHRTPGIDGYTVVRIRRIKGEDAFLQELRANLRAGAYRPSPCRRKLIPKRGKPGEFRPLGIPTVADRVVQAAVKQILEPIFEAQFWHVSYGFRPGRGVHAALEYFRIATTPRARSADGKRYRPPYAWVIEGDIKSCFDRIDHHALMTRIRQRIADRKVTRLILRFLKAGVLAEEQFIRTDAGTPQGGILSPLLANIALSTIEQQYERWVHKRPTKRKGAETDGQRAACNARKADRRMGRTVCLPLRYADDFLVLVHGSQADAENERTVLAEHLRKTLGLELSADKTRITPITESVEFLGHRLRLKETRHRGLYTALEIPKHKAKEIRRKVKRLTGRSTTGRSLSELLRELNPILRGWGHFYRFCFGAHRLFSHLDWYVGSRLWRWLRNKHPTLGARRLMSRYIRPSRRGRASILQDNGVEPFLTSTLKVQRYRLGWVKLPDFAIVSGEPDA